ncbi:uncharacterized protein JCM15063_005049 [Sporobolomyces koalae]|uniref:uncharacterized protein n=1 Tax=Sporobolomyces koalae TaxID=500713 RepID=UPI00316DDDD8
MANWHQLLDQPASSPRRQQPLPPAPTVCQPLPEFANLERTALSEARLAQRQHLLQNAIESPLELPTDALPPAPRDGEHPNTTVSSTVTSLSGKGPAKGRSPGAYEPFQVLRAIERHDVMTLHDIKASNFELLITGTPLPIVYAMRLGATHQDMAILLIGAMSRKVNDVTDDELAMMQPATKATLRSLRASLKIAITTSLASTDTSLIASFLQTVVMSEGSRWLLSSTQTLSLAFRTGPSSKPIASAESIMSKWCSRELKEAQVSAVSEYLANGTWDLCLLAMWSVASDQVRDVEPLPLYFFGRDDRMLKAVEERISVLKQKGHWNRVSKTLRGQLDTTIEILSHRQVNPRERVHQLKLSLDQQP